MVKNGRKSNITITGLLPRDKSKSKRRNKLLKVNRYLSNFCKNEKRLLFMVQGEGWLLHDNILDKSLYYDDYLHLVEPGNSKFTLNISNAINNFNELKFNLQSKVSRQLSVKPPLTFISKPLPTNSPPKLLPPVDSTPKPPPPISPPKPLSTNSPPKPLSTTSPHKSLPTTSPPKPLPTLSPPKPPLATSPHKPLLKTSPPKLLPTTSPPKPTPSTTLHKPLSKTSPYKPIPRTSPSEPLHFTSLPKPPTTTSPHKPLPTTSPSLSSLVKMKLKLKKSNVGFCIFPFYKISFLLFLLPIFSNFVNNFKYSVFITTPYLYNFYVIRLLD